MSENKETEQEVTNEQIMEHLKSIERAQGCVTNGIATLFSILYVRGDTLKLQPIEIKMLREGMQALAICTDNMAEISGLNEETKKVTEVDDLLDFLKEILK